MRAWVLKAKTGKFIVLNESGDELVRGGDVGEMWARSVGSSPVSHAQLEGSVAVARADQLPSGIDRG